MKGKFTTILFLILLFGCVNQPAQQDFYSSVKSNYDCVYMLLQESGETVVGAGTAVAYNCIVDGNEFKTSFFTCAHCVENSVFTDIKLFICYNQKGRELAYTDNRDLYRLKAQVELVDKNLDLAIVTIRTINRVKVVDTQDDGVSPSSFSEIYILGFPYKQGLHFTSGVTTFTDYDKSIASNVSACYGNSGGGVFSSKTHKLIGVIRAIYSGPAGPYWNLSYFTPLSALRGAVK